MTSDLTRVSGLYHCQEGRRETTTDDARRSSRGAVGKAATQVHGRPNAPAMSWVGCVAFVTRRSSGEAARTQPPLAIMTRAFSRPSNVRFCRGSKGSGRPGTSLPPTSPVTGDGGGR